MAGVDVAAIVDRAMRRAQMGKYAPPPPTGTPTASAAPPPRHEAATASTTAKHLREPPRESKILFPRRSPTGLAWWEKWPMPDGEMPVVAIWRGHMWHMYKESGITRLVGYLGDDGGDW